MSAGVKVLSSLAVVVVFGSLAATTLAGPAVAPPNGEIRGIERAFAGWGVGHTRCVTACSRPIPFYLGVEVADGTAFGQFCDFDGSWCDGRDGPLWTSALDFYCHVISPTESSGTTTLYGGRTFGTRWWTFKVVDRGPGRIDEMGISKAGLPPDFEGSPMDDPTCGAGELPASPLVAGDFRYVTGGSR